MFKKSAPRSSAHLFFSPVSIIAHRGGAREAPENTLAAFGKAVGKGYAIECDVRLSKDERIIVFHDETLERTTNGHGRVADKNYDDLKVLDAGEGERIPKLLDVFDLIGGKVPLIIEVKCKERGNRARRMAKALTDDVRVADMMNHVVIASFNPVILYHVRKLMPEVLRSLIFSKRSLFELKALLGKPDFLMPNYHLVDRHFVKRMHDRGYRVFPWTVDDKADAQRMIESGVDGIITNHPSSLS